MRIYLIGFMGSGKTYIGKRLASKLGFDFLDLDHFLEEKEGKKITEIFSIDGESKFRALEQQYLHTTTSLENTVISTGGGAPCFFDNMAWINAHGISIYLKTSTNLLLGRLRQGIDHRPILQGKTGEELRAFINQKIIEREPFYTQAKIIYSQNIDSKQVIDDLATQFLGDF